MSHFVILIILGLIHGAGHESSMEQQPSPTSNQPVPSIRAQSKAITIIDGDDTLTGEIVPELDPDVYVYHPTSRRKRVSFITDTERIDFDVDPGKEFDFAIVLNGRTCRQRITSKDPNAVEYVSKNHDALKGDRIPFTLGPNNAIHITGSINGSSPLDLIFDTGASLGVISEQGLAKGALVKEGNTNQFEISGIAIKKSSIISINYQGRLKADGVLGYNAFAGKIVAIDYDNYVMTIYPSLPVLESGYRKTDLVWRQSATFIEIALGGNVTGERSLALFDTGAKWSLSCSKKCLGLHKQLEKLPSVGSRDGVMASGHKVHSKVVEVPSVVIAGFEMHNVQADVEDSSTEQGLTFNILGNDFLKRFNVIVDYQRSEVYLMPNHLQYEPYNSVFDYSILVWTSALLACGIGILYSYRRYLKQTPLRPSGS